MICNYTTDADGRIESLTSYPLETDKPMIDIPDDQIANARDYILQAGKLIYDKYIAPISIGEKIAELKTKLGDSNGDILEAMESIIGATSITGLLSALAAARKTYAATLTDRAQWREELAALMQQINTEGD